MKQRIAHIALVVKEYDEAIDFYTQKLDFTLLEDTKIDEKKRWVMVAPPGAKECCLLLAKAAKRKAIYTFISNNYYFQYLGAFLLKMDGQ